jgi:hypothetical protein
MNAFCKSSTTGEISGTGTAYLSGTEFKSGFNGCYCYHNSKGDSYSDSVHGSVKVKKIS